MHRRICITEVFMHVAIVCWRNGYFDRICFYVHNYSRVSVKHGPTLYINAITITQIEYKSKFILLKIILHKAFTHVLSTFPIVVVCFHGCVPEVVATSYADNFIYIPGKLGFLCLILWSLMMCANNRIHFNLVVVFVCLHTTHYLNMTYLKVVNF